MLLGGVIILDGTLGDEGLLHLIGVGVIGVFGLGVFVP